MTLLRSLPIRLEPLPGESLDSWLEYYAGQCNVRHLDLLRAIGLHQAWTALEDYTVYLQDDEADRIAIVTGVPVRRLHAMTLQTYDGQATVINWGLRSTKRMELWSRGKGSRFCPRCLHERDGRWSLRWRLSWAFACTKHQILLPHECPGCGTRVRTGPRSATHEIPPHQCTALRPTHGVGCRSDLRTTPATAVPPDSPILEAQRWIDAALDQIESDDAPAESVSRQTFNDLRTLAAWWLRRYEPGDALNLGPEIDEACQQANENGQFAPTSALVTAAALTAAVQMLSQPLAEASVSVVRTLLDRDRGQLQIMAPAEVRKKLEGASDRVHQLVWRAMDSSMGNVDRLRFRSGGSRPRPPEPGSEEQILQRARWIPRLFWQGGQFASSRPAG